MYSCLAPITRQYTYIKLKLNLKLKQTVPAVNNCHCSYIKPHVHAPSH